VLEEAGILNSALRSSLEPSKVRDRFRYIIVARALLDCVILKYIFLNILNKKTFFFFSFRFDLPLLLPRRVPASRLRFAPTRRDHVLRRGSQYAPNAATCE
jgi:hypothetical protein